MQHEIHEQHCRCTRCDNGRFGSFVPNQIAAEQHRRGFQIARIGCLTQIVAFGIPALIFLITFLTK